MENVDKKKDTIQQELVAFKSRKLKRKSEEGRTTDCNIGIPSLENERPSPKLRKYSFAIPTVKSDKQEKEETDLLPCQSTVNELLPERLNCKTEGINKCKETKKPLITLLDHLNEESNPIKSAVGYILSPRAVRPFKCSFCGKEFKYFTNLKSHTIIVHKKMVESSPKDSKNPTVQNGQVFQCEICFRTFKYFSNLRTHRLVHTSSDLDLNKS